MLRAIYTTSSGESTVENIKPHTRLIEMLDGLHTITKTAIYRDIDDERTSYIFFWQGVTPAEGANVTEDMLKTIEVCKQHHQPIALSRYWRRKYSRGMWWALRGIYFSTVLVWIGCSLYVLFEVVRRLA